MDENESDQKQNAKLISFSLIYKILSKKDAKIANTEH